ncbi:MAG TPA: tetratricopeptide repeat protein [Vicinamibacterales bacterium]|nr:tetratricopeptide repeat protein [Vicinamibacterales bacterium]
MKTPPLSHVLVAACIALLLNSAYLAAFSSPTLWYYTNVALHPMLGIALALAVVPGVWFRRRVIGSLAAAGLVGVGVSLLLGLVVLVVGATRPYQPVLYAHVATATIGSGLLAVHVWRVASGSRATVRAVRAGVAVAFLVAVTAAGAPIAREADRRHTYRVENPTSIPTSMEAEGAGLGSPFFPSSADTTVRGLMSADFLLTSETCGRCHSDIYEQWNSSAHHFSSFNNQWYRKSVEYMQDLVGTEPSKWCAGCHDHALLFNGRFDRPAREQIDTPEAQAGLGCVSCHSIVHVASTMGQGHFVIEYPPLHDLATSDNPLLQQTHDLLLALAPEPHRTTFLKPFHTEQSAEFCSLCHKEHLDAAVSGYRWMRGFDEYDSWQASGVSGQGARAFYYPERSLTCRDCHMPLVPSNDPAAENGYVRSHRFPGANTALPFVNHDAEQLRVVQDFLQDGQISVDVFGITRIPETKAAAQPRATGVAADTLAPLDGLPVVVRRGESVRVEVVVRTRNVGHDFPAGTIDAFDVWVEFEAVDDRGRVLLHSGVPSGQGAGPVDPSAHFYGSLQLDAHGNPINKRNGWMTRSIAYTRLIPAGAADTVHYRVDVPDDVGDRIVLRAKVNYRKFAWWNTQWAFAGMRDPSQPNPRVTGSYDDGAWVFTGDTSDVSGQVKAIPDIPTTVMAHAEASVSVINHDAALPEITPSLDLADRERWNDYGIGLLLQGDLRGAETAFRTVMAIDPTYADGPVNVARVLLQEGDVEAAMSMLDRALALAPRLARAHFFSGTALKTLGQYDEALVHLRVALEQFPRDRVVLGQVGRIQFLERRFEEAVATFQQVLAIDPEDRQAHYNLMLCYRATGDAALAAREQVLYERFKADEAAQAITGPYRRRSPNVNNERQPVHEHRQMPGSESGFVDRLAPASIED